jgi:putative ABC transport system permease protein
MFKNYLKITFRNLLRNKTFSFITIFGLGLSMSICLLVLMRLKDQLSYDTFHPNAERTYRIITQLTNEQGSTFRFASTPLPLAPMLKHDYNFIESTVQLYTAGSRKVAFNKKELSIRPAFTEPGFFNVFGFKLQQGSAGTALQEPNSIVLSSETAKKFFGTVNPIGKFLSIDRFGDFMVTGVLSEPPAKSHIDFDAYLSISSVPVLEKTGKLSPALNDWNNITAGYTYLKIKKDATQRQIAGAVEKLTSAVTKTSTFKGKESFAFDIQPFKKIILGEELQYSLGNVGSKSKSWAEIAIAFIILLSACFNYTNLSVARSLKRGKEVGIRKVAGAFRWQVFTQFVVESVCIALFSLIIACVLLKLIMDYAPFAGEMVPAGASVDSGLIGWFVWFSLFTGLVAGVLPAWALSSFKPVEVLKNLSNIKLFGGNRFRKTLMVAQFSLSLIIIIFTLIFSKQFNYMATADPGFNAANVLTIPLQGADYKLLSNHISQLNGVEQLSAVSDNLGRNTSGKSMVKKQPGDQAIQMDYYDADDHFAGIMKLKLLAGNSFPANIIQGQEQNILLNERAIRMLKINDPAAAIGTQVWIDDSTQARITGVLKDFYFRGMEGPVTPLMIRNRPGNFAYLNIRTSIPADKKFIAAVERAWKQVNPLQPFTYSNLKETLYERQSAGSTVSMLSFLGFMSVTIACLGLLGMIVYTTETRKKEIGIRKVMGASVSAIMYLLSGGFLRLVFIAGLIAIPVSYITGYLFLNMFANRISIGILPPLAGFLGLLCIVLLTIGIRVYQAATENPVKNLRTE